MGKNSISGFALFLKKCEQNKSQNLYQKEISTPHIIVLILKAIPVSSS